MYSSIVLCISFFALHLVDAYAMEQKNAQTSKRSEKKETLSITKHDFSSLFFHSRTLKTMVSDVGTFNTGYPIELTLPFNASYNDLKAFELLIKNVHSNNAQPSYQNYLQRAQQCLTSLPSHSYLLFLQLYNYFDLDTTQDANKAIYDALIDHVAKNITTKTVAHITQLTNKQDATELTDKDISYALALPDTFIEDIHRSFIHSHTINAFAIYKKFSNCNGEEIKNVVWNTDSTGMAAQTAKTEILVIDNINNDSIEYYSTGWDILSIHWHNFLTVISRGQFYSYNCLFTSGGSTMINHIKETNLWDVEKIKYSLNNQAAKVYSNRLNEICLPIKCCRLFNNSNIISDFEWSPDGKQIAVAYTDDSIVIWDAKSGTPIKNILTKVTFNNKDNYKTTISCIAWSHDNNYLATGHRNGTVTIWNATTQTTDNQPVICYWPRIHKKAVTAIAWSPDNLYVASGSTDSIINIYDIKGRTLIQQLKEFYIDPINSLAFSPNNKFLASGHSKQNIIIWELQSFAQTLKQLQDKKNRVSKNTNNPWGEEQLDEFEKTLF